MATSPKTDSPSWDEIRKLFEKCLEEPKESRFGYLQNQTVNNPKLREAVERLLKNHTDEEREVLPAARSFMRIYEKRFQSKADRKSNGPSVIIPLALVVVILILSFPLFWRWQHETRSIFLPKSQTKSLAPGNCTVDISSTPPGALLYLNSIRIGITPATVRIHCNKDIAIRLEHDGRAPYETTFQATNPQSQLLLQMK